MNTNSSDHQGSRQRGLGAVGGRGFQCVGSGTWASPRDWRPGHWVVSPAKGTSHQAESGARLVTLLFTAVRGARVQGLRQLHLQPAQPPSEAMGLRPGQVNLRGKAKERHPRLWATPCSVSATPEASLSAPGAGCEPLPRARALPPCCALLFPCCALLFLPCCLFP